MALVANGGPAVQLCERCRKPVTSVSTRLKCDICFVVTHISCLQNPTLPTPLLGDTYFSMLCAKCANTDVEVIKRDKVNWLTAVVIAMHNLRIRSPEVGREGFYHWKMHVAAFLERHWQCLFGMQMKKRRTWLGTIAGTMSHWSGVIFKSGLSTLKESGWWKLINDKPPADLIAAAPSSVSRQPSTLSLLKPQLAISAPGSLASSPISSSEHSFSTEVLIGRKRTRGVRSSIATAMALKEKRATLLEAKDIRKANQQEKLRKQQITMSSHLNGGGGGDDDDELGGKRKRMRMGNEENSFSRRNSVESTQSSTMGDITPDPPQSILVSNKLPKVKTKAPTTWFQDVRLLETESLQPPLILFSGDEPTTPSSPEGSFTHGTCSSVSAAASSYPPSPSLVFTSLDIGGLSSSCDNAICGDVFPKGCDLTAPRLVDVVVSPTSSKAESIISSEEQLVDEIKGSASVCSAEEDVSWMEELLTSGSISSPLENGQQFTCVTNKKVAMPADEEEKLLDRINKTTTSVKDSKLRQLKKKLHVRHQKRLKGLRLNALDKNEIQSLVDIDHSETADGAISVNNDDRLSVKPSLSSVPRVLDRYQIVLSSSSYANMKGCSFLTRLVGRNPNDLECIKSPHTGRILKPYIRRDFLSEPCKLRLMRELLAHTRPGEQMERHPIDFMYVRPSHIPSINQLAREFFWPGIDLAECLHYPDFSCVALYRKVVVGFAFLVPDVSHIEAYVSFIFTHPEWRRVGIAKFMLYHLIQTCMGKDLTLHVSVNNPAIFLYQKFGFKVEEYLTNFYDKYLPPDSKECKNAIFLRLSR